ncbi:MAG: SMP-30/gluconolactonase/LRE family protein [Woeseiaceae bacterium]|nr:SMP-30/gluconolactonase/LRE family protein [Woeseiaceae bacterium]
MAGRPLRNRLVLPAALLVVVIAWLAFWPVPIEPRVWQAPADAGHVDPYAPNDRLRAAAALPIAPYSGPEDAALGPDGALYVSSADGTILRLAGNGRPTVYADVGGRPLGLAFDNSGNLLVANALRGLQQVDTGGRVTVLVESADGQPVRYANNVAVAADGRVYFSDSSARFSPAAHGGAYAASLLDIMEHDTTGRVIVYDPVEATARTFADGLAYANGVAVSRDQRYLLVAETAHYRVWRYSLEDPAAARVPVIGNLPGFPDNLTAGLHDRIWVGLVAPRNALLDRLAPRPFLRKVVQRLPPALRPAAEPHSHVLAINPAGQVLMDLQDTAATLPALTGVLETRDALYLTSLFGERIGRLDKADLAPR